MCQGGGVGRRPRRRLAAAVRCSAVSGRPQHFREAAEQGGLPRRGRRRAVVQAVVRAAPRREHSQAGAWLGWQDGTAGSAAGKSGRRSRWPRDGCHLILIGDKEGPASQGRLTELALRLRLRLERYAYVTSKPSWLAGSLG